MAAMSARRVLNDDEEGKGNTDNGFFMQFGEFRGDKVSWVDTRCRQPAMVHIAKAQFVTGH